MNKYQIQDLFFAVILASLSVILLGTVAEIIGFMPNLLAYISMFLFTFVAWYIRKRHRESYTVLVSSLEEKN
ncbi:MAG: hypothetical protein KAI71_00230 [Candidatus Pacebacteria bacterium]|nr:hypothetical protein [Candidatus Paceibacterota bacterium]